MKHHSLDKLRKFAFKIGLWKPGVRFSRYCEKYLFKNIDLNGKSLLDVGCGSGDCMIWAALKGANPVIGLEPFADGSGATRKNRELFHARLERWNLKNVERLPYRLQDFDYAPATFDVVLMTAAINHLDEQMCVALPQNPRAKQLYSTTFQKLRLMMKSGGKLIVTDCSGRNLFGDLGLKNTLARKIDWRKHHSPKFWARLLKEAGFTNSQISWEVNYLSNYLGIYRVPWLISYLTTSRFRLEMTAS
ncbi:methyltransferase domain-containing protein [candidate division KSB1 bacterium]|nr:class I SAM-dependent methyltransferase [candidate division KSB1 bacterium]NIV95444.1 methyltransferase domain-containing protein [candidate division KSB1 bacterium]NIW20956.1 methyltransferase domain-containing protein [candidate division KSB1 bacterium]NIW71415.1 methyltransferase domain-containing protein [candidate division KSB1 bacterium]